ncbi:Protein kinase, putative [Hondaea fermentalgiana]|uniref:Protein kinase, putative n=1 Tax=Hondaea fermentalgiana TaxID=2315210 RepID=A0A2R5G629_9STRA|nr:Protein kinase, putative [Hondaea fermentalgiana]|eukprot:GBG26512.1 Protein kinase, putative [Hondaea fermentalgiana]
MGDGDDGTPTRRAPPDQQQHQVQQGLPPTRRRHRKQWDFGRKKLHELTDKARARARRLASSGSASSDSALSDLGTTNRQGSGRVLMVSRQALARFNPFGTHGDYEDDEILTSFLEHSAHSDELRQFHEVMSAASMPLPSRGRGTSVAKLAKSRSPSSSSLNSASSQLPSSNGQKDLLTAALTGSSAFASIEEGFCHELYKSAVEITVSKGESVYLQGQTGALMFVVISGNLQLRRKVLNTPAARILRKCGPGDVLCEAAMLEPLLHRESAVVISDEATLLALHRLEYQLAALRFAENNIHQEDDAADFLQNIYLFQNLSPESRMYIVSKVVWKTFAANEVILAEHTSEPGLIIIDNGEAALEIEYRKRDSATMQLVCTREEVRCLHRGELFAEAAIISEELRSADVGYRISARERGARVGILTHEVLAEALSLLHAGKKTKLKQDQSMLQALHIGHALSHHPLFSERTSVEIFAIADRMSVTRLSAGQVLPGTEGLWLILDGALTVFQRSEPLVSLTAGDCFGDASALVGDISVRNFGSRFFATSPTRVARATGEVICALISREILTKLGIECSDRASTEQGELPGVPDKNVQSANEGQEPQSSGADSGSNSKLYYARHRPSDRVLAVKEVLDLGAVNQGSFSSSSSSLFSDPEWLAQAADEPRELGHSAHVEIALMLRLASTNTVPRIFGIMAEPQRALVTVGMDPMIGGDLAALIASHPQGLPLESFKFYAACLVSTLKVLFENDILHRDIKPGNIMVDATGYLRLIDFGISKGNMCGETARTSTLCGTPKYMAPEIARLVLGRGISYGLAVDWWALGVTLFELACGFNPFEFTTAPSTAHSPRAESNAPAAQEEAQNAATNVHIVLHRVVSFAEAFAKKSLPGSSPTGAKDSESVAQDELAGLPGGLANLSTLAPEWNNAIDLILRLLQPSLYTRLGVGVAGPRGAVEHPFFDNFPWRELRQRQPLDAIDTEPHVFENAATSEGDLESPKSVSTVETLHGGDKDDDDDARNSIESRLIRQKLHEVTSNKDLLAHTRHHKRQSLGLLSVSTL